MWRANTTKSSIRSKNVQNFATPPFLSVCQIYVKPRNDRPAEQAALPAHVRKPPGRLRHLWHQHFRLPQLRRRIRQRPRRWVPCLTIGSRRGSNHYWPGQEFLPIIRDNYYQPLSSTIIDQVKSCCPSPATYLGSARYAKVLLETPFKPLLPLQL